MAWRRSVTSPKLSLRTSITTSHVTCLKTTLDWLQQQKCRSGQRRTPEPGCWCSGRSPSPTSRSATHNQHLNNNSRLGVSWEWQKEQPTRKNRPTAPAMPKCFLWELWRQWKHQEFSFGQYCPGDLENGIPQWGPRSKAPVGGLDNSLKQGLCPYNVHTYYLSLSWAWAY